MTTVRNRKPDQKKEKEDEDSCEYKQLVPLSYQNQYVDVIDDADNTDNESDTDLDVVIFNDAKVLQFRIMVEAEIINKRHNELIEHAGKEFRKNASNLSVGNIDKFIDTYLPLIGEQELVRLLNHKCWDFQDKYYTILEVACMRPCFHSANLIIKLIKLVGNINYTKFVDLIKWLKFTINYKEYPIICKMSMSLMMFTFDEFISICRTLLDAEEEINIKHDKALELYFRLNVSYIHGFNDNGYKFMEELLTKYINLDMMTKIVFVSCIPYYYSTGLIGENLAEPRYEKRDTSTLFVLTDFITGINNVGSKINNQNLKNIITEKTINYIKESDQMCLMYACKFVENDKLFNTIKFLTDNGATINTVDEFDNNALHYIVSRDNVDNVRVTLKNENVKKTINLLLSLDINYMHKNRQNKTVLDYLTSDTCEYLIDINQKKQGTKFLNQQHQLLITN